MSVAAAVVLWLGVAILLVSLVGLVAGRTPLDRLHFAGLGSVPAPMLVAAAVGLEQGLSGPAVRAWVAIAFVAAAAPVLSAAAARAIRAEHLSREPSEDGG